MNPTQKAIIPGIIFGVLALVGLSQVGEPPLSVSAATAEAAPAQSFNSLRI